MLIAQDRVPFSFPLHLLCRMYPLTNPHLFVLHRATACLTKCICALVEVEDKLEFLHVHGRQVGSWESLCDQKS